MIGRDVKDGVIIYMFYFEVRRGNKMFNDMGVVKLKKNGSSFEFVSGTKKLSAKQKGTVCWYANHNNVYYIENEAKVNYNRSIDQLCDAINLQKKALYAKKFKL